LLARDNLAKCQLCPGKSVWDLPLLLESTTSLLTRPVPAPIIPNPTDSSSISASCSALPNSILFCNFLISVWAYASFCFLALDCQQRLVKCEGAYLFPPLFFLFVSWGIGSAFVILFGGGSAIFTIRFVNSAIIFLP
jgi:hypothetical protein